MENEPMINLGGNRYPQIGNEYIYTLISAEYFTQVEYPDDLRLDAKKMPRKVSDLTPEERARFDATPVEPMIRKDGSAVLDFNGNPMMKPKSSDVVRLVFKCDETGLETGHYDGFNFKCYSSDGSYKVGKDFFGFIQTATGKSTDDIKGTGMKFVWDIIPKGTKIVVEFVASKDGKYARIGNIKPYMEGMVIRKNTPNGTTGADNEKMNKLIAAIKMNQPISGVGLQNLSVDGLTSEEVLSFARRGLANGVLVKDDSGKIIVK